MQKWSWPPGSLASVAAFTPIACTSKWRRTRWNSQSLMSGFPGSTWAVCPRWPDARNRMVQFGDRSWRRYSHTSRSRIERSRQLHGTLLRIARPRQGIGGFGKRSGTRRPRRAHPTAHPHVPCQQGGAPRPAFALPRASGCTRTRKSQKARLPPVSRECRSVAARGPGRRLPLRLTAGPQEKSRGGRLPTLTCLVFEGAEICVCSARCSPWPRNQLAAKRVKHRAWARWQQRQER
jgi:hypothetical protein